MLCIAGVCPFSLLYSIPLCTHYSTQMAMSVASSLYYVKGNYPHSSPPGSQRRDFSGETLYLHSETWPKPEAVPKVKTAAFAYF